jgi:hypothetical protein
MLLDRIDVFDRQNTHSIFRSPIVNDPINMNKLSLVLTSSSALLAAALQNLLLDLPAVAIDNNTAQNDLPYAFGNRHLSPFTCNHSNCTGNNLLAISQRLIASQKSTVSKPQNQLELNFTAEESDAAIAKFGCDCPRSINTLRQTRGVTVGVEGEYLPPNQKPKPCKDGKLGRDSKS